MRGFRRVEGLRFRRVVVFDVFSAFEFLGDVGFQVSFVSLGRRSSTCCLMIRRVINPQP